MPASTTPPRCNSGALSLDASRTKSAKFVPRLLGDHESGDCSEVPTVMRSGFELRCTSSKASEELARTAPPAHFEPRNS